MRKFIALLLCGFLLAPASAGQMPLLGAGLSVAAAGYVGPVNAVPGATHCWSLRACTTALVGANAIELRESGGNTLQTFATIAGGGLDLAAIASFKGVNNLFVRRIFDQIGTDHFIQTNNPDQPAFILAVAAGGTLPVIRDSGALSGFLNIALAGGAISQPHSISVVARRTTGTTSSLIAGGGSSGVQFGSSGQIQMYSGSLATVSGNAENQFHSINSVFNGTSSDLNIDGTANTVNPGTGTLGATVGFLAFAGVGAAVETEMMEQLIYPSAVSGANSSLLYTNQRTYWAY